MSEDSISIVITVGIIALMFAWVPLLDVVCPHWWSFVSRTWPNPMKREETKKDEPSAGETSREVGRVAGREMRHGRSSALRSGLPSGLRSGSQSDALFAAPVTPFGPDSTRLYAARVLPRATRRLAEQSQDVLHALSSRERGARVRHQSAAPPISSISE